MRCPGWLLLLRWASPFLFPSVEAFFLNLSASSPGIALTHYLRRQQSSENGMKYTGGGGGGYILGRIKQHYYGKRVQQVVQQNKSKGAEGSGGRIPGFGGAAAAVGGGRRQPSEGAATIFSRLEMKRQLGCTHIGEHNRMYSTGTASRSAAGGSSLAGTLGHRRGPEKCRAEGQPACAEAAPSGAGCGRAAYCAGAGTAALTVCAGAGASTPSFSSM